MSIEAVAARAGTGKASIYRRWRSKEDLLIDAVIDIGDDGDTFTNTVALEILDTSGNPIATGGCAAGTATRFK